MKHSQIFEKYSDKKFNENPPSGSRVVSRGQIGGQMDMTKLIIVFHTFAKKHKTYAKF
jgi:hypothetical protein